MAAQKEVRNDLLFSFSLIIKGLRSPIKALGS